jgi:DNA helicase-2/ATP-dependent DNA helicase PcrA
MITDYKEAYETKSLYDFVEYVVSRAGIKGLYNTDSEEDVDRTMNIDQLLQSVKSYEHLNDDANLIDYLESVTLQSSLDEEDNDLASVSISTVHASKGLEFDYVFIIGIEEGKFPLARALDSADELEEERRLMYVAVTRARKKLYLTRAKSRYMYGKRENQSASRFVKEMGIVKQRPDGRSIYNNYSNGNYSYGYNSQVSNKSTYQNTSNSTYSNYSSYSDYAKKSSSFGNNNLNTNNLSSLQGIVNNKISSQKKSFAEYKVGVQVLHAKFGVGTIVKVDGGDNNYVSIDFGKLGVKTLSLNFAPLQILK